jgi:hypothetical protein
MVIGDGFVHCPDHDGLENAVKAAQDINPATDQQLIDYIAAVMKEGFESPNWMFWSNPVLPVIRKHESITKEIVGRLLADMDAKQNDSALSREPAIS